MTRLTFLPNQGARVLNLTLHMASQLHWSCTDKMHDALYSKFTCGDLNAHGNHKQQSNRGSGVLKHAPVQYLC